MFSQATQRARDVQSAQPVTTGMLKQHYSNTDGNAEKAARDQIEDMSSRTPEEQYNSIISAVFADRGSHASVTLVLAFADSRRPFVVAFLRFHLMDT
jgi:hypothetical protein